MNEADVIEKYSITPSLFMEKIARRADRGILFLYILTVNYYMYEKIIASTLFIIFRYIQM